MPEKLTLRELNRATLARQMLLKRADASVIEATEKLVGLQSQIPNPPYTGLWTRLKTFERDDLTTLIKDHQIVRAAMMRSTLHLVTRDDHQKLRMTLQPALERALRSFFGKRGRNLDMDKLVTAAKPFLEVRPATTGELKDFLLTIAPDEAGDAMAYAIRTHLPLVQVYPAGIWGAGTRASYTTAESYFGQPESADLKYMLQRYLRAFGPASIMDFQAWAGLVSLKKVIEPMKADFVIYEDENGKELLDVPDMPLPGVDTPAPVRFIPDYDNLLVSHKDRRRVIADEDRKYVFLSAARVLGTVLIDGFVGATWKTERDKNTAILRVTSFEPLSKRVQQQIESEGNALLRFMETDVDDYRVAFVKR